MPDMVLSAEKECKDAHRFIGFIKIKPDNRVIDGYISDVISKIRSQRATIGIEAEFNRVLLDC